MKRKTLLLAVLAVLSLASCRKQYTCNCVFTITSNNNGSTTTSQYRNTSTTYSEKMKKEKADAACDHEAIAVQSTYTALFTNNGTIPPDPSLNYNTTCTLQ
jgi:hypothetical protein